MALTLSRRPRRHRRVEEDKVRRVHLPEWERMGEYLIRTDQYREFRDYISLLEGTADQETAGRLLSPPEAQQTAFHCWLLNRGRAIGQQCGVRLTRAHLLGFVVNLWQSFKPKHLRLLWVHEGQRLTQQRRRRRRRRRPLPELPVDSGDHGHSGAALDQSLLAQVPH